MKCPIMNKECEKDNCAWYHRDLGMCAILILAERLADFQDLYAIEHGSD